MIAEKGRPALPAASRQVSRAVLGDRARRDVPAELCELAGNPVLAPQAVLSPNAPDEGPQLDVDRRPADPTVRAPTPRHVLALAEPVGTGTRPTTALDVAPGKVIGECYLLKRAVEFRRFLSVIDSKGPAGAGGPRRGRQLLDPRVATDSPFGEDLVGAFGPDERPRLRRRPLDLVGSPGELARVVPLRTRTCSGHGDRGQRGCNLWWLRYVSGVDYRAIVTIEPGKRGGKPCIRGLRITVYDVLEYLASGMSEAEILADFPDLTSDDIRACLAFAADRERRLLSVPAA